MFSRLRVLASRIRGFFAGHRLDEDFQRELASHLDMLTEENIRRGLPPDEARRQARLRLGAPHNSAKRSTTSAAFPGSKLSSKTSASASACCAKIPASPPSLSSPSPSASVLLPRCSPCSMVLLKSLPYPDAQRIVAIDTQWTDSGRVFPATAGGDLKDLRGATDSFQAFSYYIGEEDRRPVSPERRIRRRLSILSGVFPRVHDSAFRGPDVRGWGCRPVVVTQDLLNAISVLDPQHWVRRYRWTTKPTKSSASHRPCFNSPGRRRCGLQFRRFRRTAIAPLTVTTPLPN